MSDDICYAVERVCTTWIVKTILCYRFTWCYFNIFSLQRSVTRTVQSRIMQEHTFFTVWTSASSNVRRTNLNSNIMVSI